MKRSIRKETHINTWYRKYPRTARERVGRENKSRIRDQLTSLARKAERDCYAEIVDADPVFDKELS